MRKIVMVCVCVALLISLPFTSLAVTPKPLVPENRIGVPTPDNGDPDGPTEGRLDDPTDWRYLGRALIYFWTFAIDLVAFSTFLEELNITADEIFDANLTEIELILMMLFFNGGMLEHFIIGCLVEAFDIWDIDKDGC